jgi:formylglycine-generating enzyme required for sulfatase activity
MIRGGSWAKDSGRCRSAYRGSDAPETRDLALGFRVLRVVTPQAPSPAVAPFGATQAKAHQQAWADYLGVPVETTNSIGMKFAVIPPGEFMRRMGKEAHQVTLTRPFELGVCEVTQEHYQRVMGATPSAFKGKQNPVEQVNWDEAVAFCGKLAALPAEKSAGYVYRLPTEAEWEYACRAGTKTEYSFGDSESKLGDYAWCGKNAGSTSHPVSGKKPNPWGLYDMHGNVWEWCQDLYGNFPNGPVIDPTGAASGSSWVRRGGSWINDARGVRSGGRQHSTPDSRHDVLGFRVLRSSIKKSQPPSQPAGQAPPPAVAPFNATTTKPNISNREFIGRWGTVGSRGQVTLYVTLSANAVVTTNDKPPSKGKWEIFGSEVRITMDDGKKRVVRSVGDKYRWYGVKPGGNWNDLTGDVRGFVRR